MAKWLTNPNLTRNCEVVGLIPGLARELWRGLWTWLRSGIAVALV